MNLKHMDFEYIKELIEPDSNETWVELLAPTVLERGIFSTAVSGFFLAAISLVAFALTGSTIAYSAAIFLGGLASLCGLIQLTSLTRRSVVDIYWFAKRPLKGSYERMASVAAAINSAAQSELDALENTQSLVRFQMEMLQGRAGFLVGAIGSIGIVPLSLFAWWAWKSQGGTHDFSQFEIYGLAFAFGIYAGSLLSFNATEWLKRINFVLDEAIKLKRSRHPLGPPTSAS